METPCAMREKETRRDRTYLAQVLQDAFLNTTLLEINARAVNYLIDDLAINVSHEIVRHGEGSGRRRSVERGARKQGDVRGTEGRLKEALSDLSAKRCIVFVFLTS